MYKKKVIGVSIAAIVVIVASAAMSVEIVGAKSEVEVQVAMILDGSGSIGPADWGTIKEGVASAVENSSCVPHDGTVELTVVQFGYDAPVNAKVEVGPVVITSANVSTVATQIRNMPYSGDMTPMAYGIRLAADTIANSPNFDSRIKQVINLATDGVPNVLDTYFPATDYLNNTVQARNYTITTLAMTVDQDEFDAEGIDISDDNRDWLKDNIVYPQPGNIAPPFVPGWVRVVANAEEFADTVCEKFEVIIQPTPPPAPVPILTPIGIIALVGLLSVVAVAAMRISVRKRR